MSEIQRKFNEISSIYNEQRRKFIPCFDDFYRVPVSIASVGTETPDVLDVGAGTGLLSAFLMDKYPKALYTLIDLSEKMMKMSMARFKGRQNVEFIIDDYTTHEFTKKYDMVVSALSIHHLENNEKERFYGKCYTLLKSGGIMINADQVRGETAYIEELNKKIWFESIENSGLTEEELHSGYDRIKLDKEAGLDQQLGWLKKAGFIDVSCIYKYYHFAVMFGRKSMV